MSPLSIRLPCAIVCDFCGQPACTNCQDAADHPTGPSHCADAECVAQCTDCQVGYRDEVAG